MTNAPLVVTCGDPTGVGLDILLRLWVQRDKRPLPPFYLLAHPDHVGAMAARLGLSVPIHPLQDPAESASVFLSALPVFPLLGPSALTIGVPSPAYAKTTLLALKIAVQHLQAGLASSLVTLPLHKASLYESGFQGMGHTDYLATLCGLAPDDAVMMLDAPALRVVPLTIHIPLAAVSQHITPARLIKAITTLDRALKDRFSPLRIAVCGLNPHAGEGGHLGEEEQTTIIPTLTALRDQLSADIQGPLPADTVFMIRVFNEMPWLMPRLFQLNLKTRKRQRIFFRNLNRASMKTKTIRWFIAPRLPFSCSRKTLKAHTPMFFKTKKIFLHLL
jgi:4-hydroxythreonine-4-phosphate dehydrogenase